MGELLTGLCIAVWLCAAPSTPPAPIESGAGAPGQHATRYERGTQDFPLVVKTIPGFDTAAEESEAREERRHKAAMERSLVEATWWLVGATILLFVAAAVQVGFFKWQLGLMRDEFNAKQRPKLIVQSVRAIYPKVGEPVAVEFALINVGGAPALIGENAFSFDFVETDRLPRGPSVINRYDIECGTLIEVGRVFPGRFQDVQMTWSEQSIVAASSPGGGLFFCGKILYGDTRTKKKGPVYLMRTGFSRQWAGDGRPFRKIPDPDGEIEYSH